MQQQLASLPQVAAAETRADQYRAIGPTEIIAGLTLAVGVMHESVQAAETMAKLLDALKQVVISAKGLRGAFVDVGMRKVPLDQLTQKDVETLTSRAGLNASPA